MHSCNTPRTMKKSQERREQGRRWPAKTLRIGTCSGAREQHRDAHCSTASAPSIRRVSLRRQEGVCRTQGLAESARRESSCSRPAAVPKKKAHSFKTRPAASTCLFGAADFSTQSYMRARPNTAKRRAFFGTCFVEAARLDDVLERVRLQRLPADGNGR